MQPAYTFHQKREIQMTKQPAVGNMMTGALLSNQILSETSSKSSAGAARCSRSATVKVGKENHISFE